jgi:hypothetical protein
MITEFKIFEMVEFENSLNYGDAVAIGKSERNIREYFKKNYTRAGEKLIGGERGIWLSRAEISDLRTKNIIKFAEEKQDDELIKMISDHLYLIQRIKIQQNSEKYNL